MRRSQRVVHRLLWPILVIVVGIGVSMALWLRLPPEEPQAQVEVAQ